MFTHELRVNYDGANGLRAVLGPYYAYDRSDSGFSRSVFFGGGRNDTTRSLSSNRNYAIFGEATVPVLERVDLIAGGRIDHNERELNSTFMRDNFNPARPDVSTADFVESQETVFLPKLGVDIELASDLRLGFVFQQGYRPGGASRNVISGTIAQFDAEFTDTFEASLRKELGRRGNLAINVFYTDWTDQQ